MKKELPLLAIATALLVAAVVSTCSMRANRSASGDSSVRASGGGGAGGGFQDVEAAAAAHAAAAEAEAAAAAEAEAAAEAVAAAEAARRLEMHASGAEVPQPPQPPPPPPPEENAAPTPGLYWKAAALSQYCDAECEDQKQVRRGDEYLLRVRLNERVEDRGRATESLGRVVADGRVHRFKLIPLFLDGVGFGGGVHAVDLRIMRPGSAQDDWGTADIPFSVLPEARGCAQMIVSVWDTGMRQAFDAFLVTFPVVGAGASGCQDPLHPATILAGPSLVSVTDVFHPWVASEFETAQDRISIYAFELPLATRDSYGVAVLDHGGTKSFEGWKLNRPLSRGFGDHAANFSAVAEQDRKRMRGATPGQWIYRQTAEFIRDNLFTDKAGRRDAFDRIRGFVNAHEGVDVSLQLYVPLPGGDEYGLMFLPLRIMAAPGSEIFSNDFNQYSPLSGAVEPVDRCISRWQVIVNPDFAKSDGSPAGMSFAVADAIARLKALEKNSWRNASLSSYDDIREYLGADEDGNDTGDDGATGLVVIAHYGRGMLGLENEEKLPISAIRRRFPPGSAAFLAACETAIPTEADGLIRQLRNGNVETFVASPLQVPVTYVVPLMDRFVTQLGDAYAKGRTPTVGELYRDAIEAMKSGSGAEIGERVLGREFVLVGNPDRRLCKLESTLENEQ